jgi:xanthine dehydrogenase accessory factor
LTVAPNYGDPCLEGALVKEISDVLGAQERLAREGAPYTLATVVGISGSAYRRPGALMLFSAAGRAAGLINAACFEADLAERAREVMRSGAARLVVYDNTAPDAIVFGLGLGCNGVVEVLLEPGSAPSTQGKLDALRRSRARGNAVTIATVISAGGRAELRPGDFLARDDSGDIASSAQGPDLSSLLQAEIEEMAGALFARKVFPAGKSGVDVFLQRVLPPVDLLVFGAGADAVPLVEIAKHLGWRVTVVDHRPAFADASRFPSADSVLLSDQVPAGGKPGSRHAVVIMTHNYDRDRTLLPILLDSPAAYVGLLGPVSKRRALLEDLGKRGFSLDPAHLAKLHAPVGLDIGAETPEEIALSIVAEIKAVLENRPGGPLRDRPGPVHGR